MQHFPQLLTLSMRLYLYHWTIAKSEHQNSEQSVALEYEFPGRKLKKVGLIHWTPSRNVILKSAAALRLFTVELVLILNN